MQRWEVTRYFMTDKLCIVDENSKDLTGPIDGSFKSHLQDLVDKWNSLVAFNVEKAV